MEYQLFNHKYLLVITLFFANIILTNKVFCQNSLDSTEIIWNTIETKLNQSPESTSHTTIIYDVSNYCNGHYNCEIKTYAFVVAQLENRFNLPMAIEICKEMVSISQKSKNWEGEANASLDLYRFFDAQNEKKQAVVHLDIAQKLFEEHNDIYGVVRCKVYGQLQSLSYQKEIDIIPEIQALLEGNDSLDEKSIFYLHRTLAGLCINSGLLKEAEFYLTNLESFLKTNIEASKKYGLPFYIALSRAELELLKTDTLSAEASYKTALKVAIEDPDKWQEINILHQLSKIERLRGNYKKARKYLAEAREKAVALKQYDLLANNYHEETFIAEKERRFEDAYKNLNKYHFYTNLFNSRNANFDLKNHYLEIEKKQIDIAKKETEIALTSKNKQLRNAFIYGGLILAVTLLLIIGFYRERLISKRLVAKSNIIEKQTEELKLLDKTKSVFFANVSHELKTPLTLLLAPLNNLAEADNLSEKQTKLFNLAKHGGNQLSILINQILSLGKLELGKLELKKVETQLFSYFQTYCAQFNSLAEKKNINYSAKINISKNVIAELDHEKCRQILYNLLSNAFKFTPTGGQIFISVSVTKNILDISVKDSGQGISNEDLPKIFERYFQSVDPNKKAIGGTGIGLAICYEYAKRFGGDIRVESKPGEGSTFTVQIPISISEMAYEPLTIDIAHEREEIYLPVNTNVSKNNNPKPQILVVEDNVSLQDYIRIILEEHYAVTIAENGQVALNVLKEKNNYQLVLSDIMMPVMDGFTLVERLKSDSQTALIPIILLSARAEIESKLKLLHFGIDDYMTKPFDERELLVRIKNLLKNQDARKASIAENEVDLDSKELVQKENVWLNKFEAYVKLNIENGSNIPDISSEFAMSESSLLRKVKSLIGLTPVQYIQELRLDFARELLETEKYRSIKEIAIKAGYSDTRIFSRNYKKRFGKLPSDYILVV